VAEFKADAARRWVRFDLEKSGRGEIAMSTTVH
jgi:hypothetical protein